MQGLENLAANLLMLRKKAGKTQREVAAEVGITAAALSAYEKGLKQPQPDYAARLANYYGVTLDHLCGLTDSAEMLGSEYLYHFTKLCETGSIPVDISVNFVPWSEYPRIENWEAEMYKKEENETGKTRNLGYVTLTIYDQMTSEFCKTYRKYLELYTAGHMDKDLFDLWKKDRFNQVIYPV